MEEECGECSFLTVELDMSSSFHRSSAELIRTNKSIRSLEPTVTILGLGWRRRGASLPVCYGWRTNNVGIRKIFFTLKRHNNNTDSSEETRLHRSDGFIGDVVNAGVFCGNKGHCGSFSWPRVEPGVDDLTWDGRLSPPPCVTQTAEAGEGRAAWCLRAAAVLLIARMNPTPIRHFGASPGSYAAPVLSPPGGGWLCSSAPRGRSARRISRSVSQWRWHALGHIPAGICRVDRRNSSKPRIKLRACSDAPIATTGFSPLLLFCFSWERLSELLMATNTVCRNTLVTYILESETSPK